jgi:hypothetical protein
MSVYRVGIGRTGIDNLVGVAQEGSGVVDPPVDTVFFLYTPPTTSVRVEVMKNYTIPMDRGKTVIFDGSTYTAKEWPTSDELEAASAFYQGGHVHTVGESVKAAIEASGVGGSFEAV